MSHIKVLLVGPYPPPYGGLAVQLYQWRQYLQQLGTYECSVLNIGESRGAKIPGCISISGYWDFLRTLHGFVRRGYLIHLLTNGHNAKSWLCSLACALAGVRNHRRTVLVFGSGNAPDYMKQAGPLLRLLIRCVIRLGGRLVCRNEQMRQALIACGAAQEKIAIIPGFLGLEPTGPEALPSRLQEIFATHSPVLGATANLDPEYGIPLMLQAVTELRKMFPRIGLVIIGPGEEATSQIVGSEIPDHAYFTGPLSHDVVLAVMKRLTLFLRPTYFDGDSLSVREALALGVPVVASDTDYRPEGVVLFRKGRLNEFVDKIGGVLSKNVPVSDHVPLQSSPRSAELLLNLYRGLAGENG
jgi:glycosyltransferase involved in cell wall biosynthesis